MAVGWWIAIAEHFLHQSACSTLPSSADESPAEPKVGWQNLVQLVWYRGAFG